MKIALGCDHRGFILKEAVVRYLDSLGHEVVDLGVNSADRADYPVYGERVGRMVADGACERGILICGTGYGISLAANQIKGVRAACCSDTYTATLTRAHNDANVLAIGAMVVGEGLTLMIIDAFLNTKFEGGRHQARLNMLDDIRARDQALNS